MKKVNFNISMVTFGLFFVTIPIFVILYFEFGRLTSTPSDLTADHEIRSYNYVSAYKDIEQSKSYPHLIEYKLYLNLRNDSNPFKLKKGALIFDATYNCSLDKHFFVKFKDYYKYNNFSMLPPLKNLEYLNANFIEIQNNYSEYTKKNTTIDSIFLDKCPIIITAEFDVPKKVEINNSNDSSVDVTKGHVGILWKFENQSLKVANVLKGSPADEMGLLPGDIITEIDGLSTDKIINGGTDKDLIKIYNALSGPPNSSIKINVIRNNSKLPELISLTRKDLGYEYISRTLSNNNIKISDSKNLIFEIICDAAKPWSINENLKNQQGPISVTTIHNLTKVGKVTDTPIAIYNNNTKNFNDYSNQKALSISPTCEVITLPILKSSKQIILLRKYNYSL